MTKEQYILQRERGWLDEDEKVCYAQRKRIENGESVGYPYNYFVERLGWIYDEQERFRLFAEEYEKHLLKEAEINEKKNLDC